MVSSDSRMPSFFLFCVATSCAFAGSGSPAVRGNGDGLALPDHIRHMPSFFLFRRIRAMRSRALALRRLRMVASASISGFCWTKLGDRYVVLGVIDMW
jgi:hypothetical protein